MKCLLEIFKIWTSSLSFDVHSRVSSQSLAHFLYFLFGSGCIMLHSDPLDFFVVKIAWLLDHLKSRDLFHPDFLHSTLNLLYSTLCHYELSLFILATLFDLSYFSLYLLMHLFKTFLREFSLAHALGLLVLLQSLQIHSVRLKLSLCLFSFLFLSANKCFLLFLTLPFWSLLPFVILVHCKINKLSVLLITKSKFISQLFSAEIHLHI
jgi:hypothetical protein